MKARRAWLERVGLGEEKSGVEKQRELDGERNQLRLFDRTSSGAQIYLDPGVPEGSIGGWKILTEGTAKPWLEGQNLKVANLEVSGSVNGNLDIRGGLTVRSNLIACGGH